jgi:hypothetical protein
VAHRLVVPPITPNGISQRPLRIASAGMIVCIGRLPPSIVFGWPGSTTKPVPRLCSITPVFSVQMPVPNAL